jgi:Xaa-Pro aminopeptidase
MSDNIAARLKETRKLMMEAGVDVYMVCTNDYHMSEYTGDYFNEREFLSGFDGSAGTLVITAGEASLFTDGRYFVQAKHQLEGTGIKLMEMGTKGVPELDVYVAEVVPDGGVLGVDGRMVSGELGLSLKSKLAEKNARIDCNFNATEKLWTDRPAFPHTKAFDAQFGQSSSDKINVLRERMGDADGHIIATLDDVNWLFNIRGRDVACNPVVMSYAFVTRENAYIYVDSDRLPKDVSERFGREKIQVKPYDSIYEDIDVLGGKKILIDPKRVNLAIYMKLEEAGADIVEAQNPTVHMKSVKNEAEISNLTDVHIDDGAALTEFIFWVKRKVKSGERITEAQAADYLDSLRAKISDFIEPSFDTISAYGANAAMMHYHAGADSAVLEPRNMLLVDSGGQYLRGTTDVTRTIVLGSLSAEQIRHYTLALKGMLRLTNAHFLYGCTGYNLDILAREALWEEGVDYRCGTGHGIGYLLNVHEAPNGFRWKHNIGKNDLGVFETGMVTSNEPGVYVEGGYGIRIENEIIVESDYENEYGAWLKFRTLTCAPIDLEAVDVTLLSEKEKQTLNAYHKWVREKLSPRFEGETREWLLEATREV